MCIIWSGPGSEASWVSSWRLGDESVRLIGERPVRGDGAGRLLLRLSERLRVGDERAARHGVAVVRSG